MNVGPITNITLKSGEMKDKRMITFADDSNYSIQLCLWEEMAHLFTGWEDKHPVIAIKCARIVEYNGKSLALSESGMLMFDPIHQRTDELLAWWKSLDRSKL